ncbi:MAG TPA: hypothetical protein VKZ63_17145 [Kofleriaceae bacterium]|nr:hypothetical protein [Kofleriaceae bacterium]
MSGLADTSLILFDCMRSALDAWAGRFGGERELLYWLLRAKVTEIGGGDSRRALEPMPDELRGAFAGLRQRTEAYWSDVRYSTLEPVTQLWGTIVNSVRVAAQSSRATEGQKRIFDFPAQSLVTFFQAARDRMEVADALYHAFKAMPAPECQALAALLNVHVDARLDAPTMLRLVRLLDHEGPMSPEETEDLASISNTHLVDAAFSGLRAHA